MKNITDLITEVAKAAQMELNNKHVRSYAILTLSLTGTHSLTYSY